MIAYCGLDCSKCIGYLATQANDPQQLANAAQEWSKQFHADVKPEHCICDGCTADKRKSFYCGHLCKIRACCLKKKFNTCGECADFACSDLKLVLDHAPEAKANLDALRK